MTYYVQLFQMFIVNLHIFKNIIIILITWNKLSFYLKHTDIGYNYSNLKILKN